MPDLNSTIKALKLALLETPKNIALRLHLAQLYEENDMYAEAVDEYLKITIFDSKNNEALLGLGRSLFKKRDYDSAKKQLEKVDNAESYYYLSQIYYREGESSKAKEYYNKAVKLDEQFKKESFEQQLEGGKIKISKGPHETSYEFEKTKISIKFKDIGGLEELKKEIQLKILLPYKKEHIFKAYGKRAGGGILLYGPPGCGKTLMAKATAGEINAYFMSLEINDILNMWSGESEKKLHQFFETARRNTPSIIFIDEIDALGAERSRFHSAELKSLVNQFLAELDGVGRDNSHILFIGATNAPWQLDSAFKRPGRFDKTIFVAPPDYKARLEILKIYTKDKPKKELDYEKLAKLTKGFSGADIKQVIEQTLENLLPKALEQNKIFPLTTKDIETAIKQVKPSVKEWFYTVENYIKYSNKSGEYDSVKEYIDKEGF